MKTLKYKSRGNEVFTLEELLLEMGYEVYISNYFGKDTDAAVRDFQLKNDLVVDGIVGPKTWAKIYEQQQRVTFFNDKFLSEKDLQEFSKKYQLELATVKAVNEVESSGKGFLLDGRPRILFEGHIFWKQLQKKAIDPNELLSEKTFETSSYRLFLSSSSNALKGSYNISKSGFGARDRASATLCCSPPDIS